MKRDLSIVEDGFALRVAAAMDALDSALSRGGEASQAEHVFRCFEEARDLLDACGSSAAPRGLALMCQTATFFLSACQPERAIAAGRSAAAFAASKGDSGSLRLALLVEAIGLCELGAYAQAVERLNQALDSAIAINDLSGQCAVWNQLGVILHQQGQAREAAEALCKVLDLADSDAGLLRYRVAALTNLALLGLDVQEFEGRGLRACLAALALAHVPSTTLDFYNRVSLETVAARLLARVGELEGARKHAALALDFSKQGGERAVALAQIAVGTVEVAAGDSAGGIGKLRAAVELARHKLKGLHFYALRALIGGYESANQPEVAKVYLEELLRISREQKEQQLLEQHHEHVEALIRRGIGGPDLIGAELQRQRERLATGELSRESVRSMMLLLEEHANAAELHDDSTSKHIYRVGRMSALIAKEIGLDENTQFMLDLSARLHDTGKLFVPDAILLKPGKLTDSERAIMQTHTTSGAEYLRKTGLPMIEVAAEIALCHHERFDGKGYPAGLRGSAIPISARIAALADVFDALTHERPYKSAWSIPEALAEIRSLRGTHFDPDLTDVFLSLVPRLQRETGDLDSFLAAEAENSRFVQTRRALAAKLKGLDPAVSAFELRR